MGKFDSFEKYLGNEDQYTPFEINNSLDNMPDGGGGIEISVDDEIDPDALANIDDLLSIAGGPGFKEESTGNEDQSVTLSGSEIKAINDSEPEETTEESEPDLSEFSALHMNDNEDEDAVAAEELAALTQKDEQAKEAEESFSMEQGLETTSAAVEAPAPNSSEDAVEGVDPDILQELSSLDTAPPTLADIEQRRAGPLGIESEEVGDLENELAAMTENENEESEFNLPVDSEQPSPTETSIQGEEESDLGDLLSQLTPGTEEKNTPVVDEKIPGIESDFSELEDILKEAGVSNETPVEKSTDETDLGDFNLPDFGEEAPEELKTESTAPSEEFIMPLEAGEEPEAFGMEKEHQETADFGQAEGKNEFSDFSAETEGMEIPESEEEMSVPETGDAFDNIEDTSNYHEINEPVNMPSDTQSDLTMNISDEKVLKIRKRINEMSDPSLRRILRNAFIEGNIESEKLEKLIAMLLLREPEENIHAFLETQLPDLLEAYEEETGEIEEAPELPVSRPRVVLYADDAKKAQEFTKEFQNITKYAAIFIGFILLLLISLWKFVFVPYQANKHYQVGLTAITNSDYITAESEFKQGEDWSGPLMKWYNRYALTYMDRKQFKLAQKKLVDALSIRPHNKETLLNYADYYQRLYPPRFAKSIEQYQKLMKMKRFKDDYEVVDRMGQSYIRWGDQSEGAEKQDHYNEASGVYNAYVGKHPNFIPAFFQLLNIALRAKNDEQINMWYEQIDRLNPRAVNLVILTALGKYYVDKREMENAKPVFLKLSSYIYSKLRVKPKGSLGLQRELTVSEAYYQYARYLLVNMDYIRALTMASNSVSWYSNNGRAYNLMGEIFMVYKGITKDNAFGLTNFQNSEDLAADYFKTAIEKTPKYYKPYMNMGHIYYYKDLYVNPKNPDFALVNALDNYQMAYQYLPKGKEEPLLFYNLGWLYYHNKRYELAARMWAPLYEKQPFNPVLSYGMGNIYLNQAREYMKERKYTLAVKRLQIAKAEYDKAIEYYETLAKRIGFINPQLQRHHEIFMQLARSYNNRGVIHAIMAQNLRKKRANEQKLALLDFFNAKDSALKVDEKPYGYAEYNIKYIYHVMIRGRVPAFDNYVPKRTTLEKLIEEFRRNLIRTI